MTTRTPAMKHAHELILDFLASKDESIRAEYQAYKEKVLSDDVGTSRTSLDKQGKKDVFRLLLKYEMFVSQVQEASDDKLPMEGLFATGLAYFLHVLRNVEILSSDGSTSNKDIEDLWATRINSAPDTFWDQYHEMEVASHFIKNDLEAYPLDDEGTDSSTADLLYVCNDIDFWVECKNKRRSTDFEWELERFGREVMDYAFTQHNLGNIVGDDSFAIRVSTAHELHFDLLRDRPARNSIVNKLSQSVYKLVRSRDETVTVRAEGIEFEVSLLSYHEGKHSIQLSSTQKTQIDLGVTPRKVVDLFGHLGFSPDLKSDHGHGYAILERASERQIDIHSCYAFDFNVPWDINYHEAIIRTIAGVLEQHVHPRLIAFVKVPIGMVLKMKEDKTENHRGKTVSKWERLKERIIGIFADSNRDNRLYAVVISSDSFRVVKSSNSKEIRLINPVKAFYNDNVYSSIPSEFIESIQSKPSIDEVTEQGSRGWMDDLL